MNARIRWIVATLTLAVGLTTGCSAAPAGSPAAQSRVPADSTASTTPEGFPLGAWTTTITEADLRAGGVTGAGELRENSGTFTMTLADNGIWTVTQKANVPIRWPVFRGTYSVTGPKSFRQQTDFPPDYTGDVVDFEWRIENGDLVLEVPNPPDRLLPIVMETHPWQPAQ
jgi:hypothetical protein